MHGGQSRPARNKPNNARKDLKYARKGSPKTKAPDPKTRPNNTRKENPIAPNNRQNLAQTEGRSKTSATSPNRPIRNRAKAASQTGNRPLHPIVVGIAPAMAANLGINGRQGANKV
jgi:hypothetical protein